MSTQTLLMALKCARDYIAEKEPHAHILVTLDDALMKPPGLSISLNHNPLYPNETFSLETPNGNVLALSNTQATLDRIHRILRAREALLLEASKAPSVALAQAQYFSSTLLGTPVAPTQAQVRHYDHLGREKKPTLTLEDLGE